MTAAGVLALAACSSGSEDGEPALATISVDNAPGMASAVVAASLQGGELGSFTSFGPTVSPLSSVQARAHSKAAHLRHAGIDAFLKQAQATVQPAFDSLDECTNAGSVATSGNVANPFTLSPNDTITFNFSQCVEGDTTVDGRFSMRVTSFAGDVFTGTFAFAVTAELTSFAVTAGGETVTANGSIAIAVDATGPAAVTTTVTSSAILLGHGNSNFKLRSYSSVRTLTAGAFTLDVSGSLTSSELAGPVTFRTTTLLQGIEGEFPSAGKVVINGANGATITVVALDNEFVRLEVDLNGDGLLEATLDRWWEDLT